MSNYVNSAQSFPLIETILSSDFNLESPRYGAERKKVLLDRIQKLSKSEQKALNAEFDFLLSRLKEPNDFKPERDLKEKGLALLLLVDPADQRHKGFAKLKELFKQSKTSPEEIVNKMCAVREGLSKPRYQGFPGLYPSAFPVDLKKIIASTECGIEAGLATSSESSTLESLKKAEAVLKNAQQVVASSLQSSAPEALFNMILEMGKCKQAIETLPPSRLKTQIEETVSLMYKIFNLTTPASVAQFMVENTVQYPSELNSMISDLQNSKSVSGDYNNKTYLMRRFLPSYVEQKFQEVVGLVSKERETLRHSIVVKEAHKGFACEMLKVAKKTECLADSNKEIQIASLHLNALKRLETDLQSIASILTTLMGQKVQGLEALKQAIASAKALVDQTPGLKDLEDFGWYLEMLHKIINYEFNPKTQMDAPFDVQFLDETHAALKERLTKLKNDPMLYFKRDPKEMADLISDLIAFSQIYIQSRQDLAAKRSEIQGQNVDYLIRCRQSVQKDLNLPAKPDLQRPEEPFPPMQSVGEPDIASGIYPNVSAPFVSFEYKPGEPAADLFAASSELIPGPLLRPVPTDAPNGTPLEQREALNALALEIEQELNNEENASQPQFDKIKNHPLKGTVHQNFYFIMLKKGLIKKQHLNWGGIVFHADEGAKCEEHIGKISPAELNRCRFQAIYAAVDGKTYGSVETVES